MARTDYGAILSTKIADTSQAIRDVNGTTGLIAPADWGTLIRAMRSAEDYENALSGLEQKTVSGSIASFTDGINGVPVKSLIANVDPVQDLHGYSKPWSGGGGKNKFNDTTGTHTINANTDTTITIGDVYLEANTTYTISCKQTPAPLASFVRNIMVVAGGGTTTYNSAGNDYTIKPMVFTPTVSGTYSIRVWGHTLSANTTYSQFQVEVGSTATAYEPYENICPITGRTSATVTHTKGDSIVTKDIYPIEPTQDGTGDSSPTNVRPIHAGLTITRDDESILEVYEGSLNLTTGALEVTHAIVDLGTLDWFNQGSYFYPVPNLDAKSGSTNWLSSCIKKKPWETSWTNMSPWEGGFGGYQFRVKDDGTSQTASEFKTRVQGFMLVYELDTPQTIQLSATELERAKAALEISTYTKTFDTCYGGKLNLTTGALEVVNGIVDLGTLTYTKTTYGSNTCFYADVPLGKSTGGASQAFAICSQYVQANSIYIASNADKTFTFGDAYIHRRSEIKIVDNDYANSTVEQFKTTMNGVQLVYELAEPYVAVLTKEEIKTFLGGNTFYADTGDVEVVYYANANL